MKYTDISEIVLHGEKLAGSQVTVAGWVRTARDSKTMAFIALNDGTCLKHLQLVIDKAKFAQEAIAPCLKNGVSLEATGVVVPAVAAGGGYEMNVESLSLVPRDRLLVETDCPYMTPVPYRGRTNFPRYVSLVADKVAEVLSLSREEVEGITTANTKRLFKKMK